MTKTLTIEAAITAALDAHLGQTDQQGVAYILHPLRVMCAVSDRSRVVAVLHDTLEDTRIDRGALERRLLTDDEYAALVLLTRPHGMTYGAYIDCIAKAEGVAGEIAREVKMADLRDNLGRMTEELSETLGPRYLRAMSKLLAVEESTCSATEERE